MKKKIKKEIKVGDEVFVIERNLDIVTKKVLGIIQGEDETRYKVDSYSCDGVTKNDLFLSKPKAEKVKQDFLDSLKFKVGELLVFKYKDYNKSVVEIGRVDKLDYSEKPYKIETPYKNIYDVTDGDVSLKINNKYIENFGKLKELDETFEQLNKEILKVIRKIHIEYEQLEEDLKKSFKKQYKWTNLNKKPLFEKRFDYRSDDY